MDYPLCNDVIASVFDTSRLGNIFGEAIGFSGKTILARFVESVTALIKNANFGYREVGEPGATWTILAQNQTVIGLQKNHTRK